MSALKGEAKAHYVASMFARISRRYDFVNTVMTGGMHHRWCRLAVLMAAGGVAGRALDVATGTGALAFAVAEQPGIRQTVGLDLVPEMIELARQKARRRGVSHQVTFLQGDALALPFPDDAFACATCGFGIRNVADVPAALAEMARVVHPGGRVVILEAVTPDENGLLQRLSNLYLHRLIPVLGRVLSGDREAYRYLPRSVDAFPLAGELAYLMEEAGLRRVRYRNSGMGLVTIHVGEKP